MSIDNYGDHSFATTNGVQLHYVSKGKGKLMLMLHGFPEFWYSWRHQITEFAQSYHTVAVDLRGYNESEKPTQVEAYAMSELIADIKGLIEALGYQDCILVAHDWGGAIAWEFAYAYPQMVEKLIVMNMPHPAKFAAGLKTPQQLFKSWYVFFFQIPLLPEFFLQLNNYQAIANSFKNMAVDKTAFSEADLSAYRHAAAKPGALTAMLSYYRCIFKSWFSGNGSPWQVIDIPTLTIWGEADTALGKELTYGTETYVKDWQIKYIPNCSHWVQQEQPGLVNSYVHDFLNT